MFYGTRFFMLLDRRAVVQMARGSACMAVAPGGSLGTSKLVAEQGEARLEALERAGARQQVRAGWATLDFTPIFQSALLPFSQIYTGYTAGLDLRRPIGYQDACAEITERYFQMPLADHLIPLPLDTAQAPPLWLHLHQCWGIGLGSMSLSVAVQTFIMVLRLSQQKWEVKAWIMAPGRWKVDCSRCLFFSHCMKRIAWEKPEMHFMKKLLEVVFGVVKCISFCLAFNHLAGLFVPCVWNVIL